MLRKALHSAFSIKEDMADYEEIKRRIMEGGEIHGTNLCILVLAILIASIGLNMNSTAVIIGAMLISPLMGSIMAIAYDFVTGDLEEAKEHAWGITFQILASLITSTLYFHFSPISTATSEILARTNPTIWDVLIAFCGGLAGAIGTTRKEKSNILPGVAIATALMPPLCTAGYGIATSHWHYVLGALTLFVFNCWFILLSTVIILWILKIPMVKTPTAIAMKKLKRKSIITTMVFIGIGILMGSRMVYESAQNKNDVLAATNQTSVATVMEEVTHIWPQITSMKIGVLGSCEKGDKTPVTEIVAIVYVSEALEGKDLELFEKWMKSTENIDQFIYEIETDEK